MKATPTNGALQSFWSGPVLMDPVSDRDLGLGYAFIVEGGRNAVYEARAFELLKAAVDRQPDDIPALVQLAQYVWISLGRGPGHRALREGSPGGPGAVGGG